MEHVSNIGYAGVGSYWSTRFSWFTALNRIKSCSGPSIEQTCLFDALFVYMCFTVRAWFLEKKTNTFSGSAVFGCPDIGTQRRTTSALLRRLMQFLANQRTLTGLLRGHWNWLRALFHQSNIFVLNRAKSKVSQWAEKNVFLKVHGYVIVNPVFSTVSCYIAIPWVKSPLSAPQKKTQRLQHSDAVVGPSPGSSWALHLQICGGIPGIMLCLVVVIDPSEKWWTSSVGIMTFKIFGET